MWTPAFIGIHLYRKFFQSFGFHSAKINERTAWILFGGWDELVKICGRRNSWAIVILEPAKIDAMEIRALCSSQSDNGCMLGFVWKACMGNSIVCYWWVKWLVSSYNIPSNSRVHAFGEETVTLPKEDFAKLEALLKTKSTSLIDHSSSSCPTLHTKVITMFTHMDLHHWLLILGHLTRWLVCIIYSQIRKLDVLVRLCLGD